MSKKKKMLLFLLGLIVMALNIAVLLRRSPAEAQINLNVTINADVKDQVQVFYSTEKTFKEDCSSMQPYEEQGTDQLLTFSVPSTFEYIRIDFGQQKSQWRISKLEFSYGDAIEEVNLENLVQAVELHQVKGIAFEDGVLVIDTQAGDPYFMAKLPAEETRQIVKNQILKKDMIFNILVILVLDFICLICLKWRNKLFGLPVELYQNRALIFQLSKNDFKTKYAGSYLGIVWAFIQPVVTILVYWFVFTVGLKAGQMDKYPFVIYLVSGIVPWFFFSDALNGGTNALLEYNYLVKKVVFKISILPMVKVISALFVHAFFIVIALVLCACFGYFPGVATLQIFYYTFCTFVFVLGVCYATSAIVIFFRDLTQIINIILQVGVWLTPIMWDLNIMNEHPILMRLFKLNPMYYIVSGYRDSMLSHTWFWEHWKWSIYFWGVTAVVFVIGTVVFKRLKIHFADVL